MNASGGKQKQITNEESFTSTFVDMQKGMSHGLQTFLVEMSISQESFAYINRTTNCMFENKQIW